MVTAPKPYGFHPTTTQGSVLEPPGVTKARFAFDSVMNQVLREFINQSAHATQLGFKALNTGDYITLDELEALIKKE